MKSFKEFLIEKSNINDPESKVLNDWLKQSKTDSNNALNKIKEHLKSDFSFKNFKTSYAMLNRDILSFCTCQAIYLELKSLIGKKSYNDIYDEINANALKVFGPIDELKRQIFDQHLFDQTRTHKERLEQINQTANEILNIVQSCYDDATSKLKPNSSENIIINTMISNIDLKDYSKDDIKIAMNLTGEKLYKKVLKHFS